jgi:hypothetical protein
MSKTYRDVVKAKYEHAYKKFRKKYGWRYHWANDIENPWNQLSHKEQMYIAPYSTPSWWNREFNNKWKRHMDRQLCTQMTLEYDGKWDHRFYINNKPHIFYW